MITLIIEKKLKKILFELENLLKGSSEMIQKIKILLYNKRRY